MCVKVCLFEYLLNLGEHPFHLALELAGRAAQHAGAQGRQADQVIACHHAHGVVFADLIAE